MNLADLRVKLGADDSELDHGLAGAESKVSKFAAGVKKAAAAGGVAAGAVLAAGFAKNLEFESAQAKLHAQLGGSAEFAGEMGKVAGDLYAGAYGDSMGQVSDAVRTVVQSGALMEDATNEQIQSITGKAMSLADAFDVDVTESMRAVGQMVRTGMAPDAEAGLDLVTRAFQQLGPQADDVLDTFTEYSTQFRKLGIDGPMALGLIQQMVKNGARDTDVAADSLKEFALRVVDAANPTTIEGFKLIGLNAEEMARKFLAGGDTAKAAFDQTVSAINSVQDPLARNTATMDLFGTQAEDLGASLNALDTSTAVQGLGDVAGAAERLDATIGDTAQARITGMQRSVEQWTASLVTADGPLGNLAAGVMAFGGPAVDMAGSLGMVAVAAGSVVPTLATTAVAVATSTGSMILSMVKWAAGVVAQGAVALASMTVTAAGMVAQWVVMAAGAMARAVVMAASWVVAMGPVGWVIAAVVGLVALIIANWDTVKAWTGAAWDWVSSKIGAAWDWITGKVGTAVQWVLDRIAWFRELPGRVAAWFGGVKDAAIGKAQELVSWLAGLPGRILDGLGDLGSLLWDAGSSIISGLWSGIQSMGSWLKSKILGFIKSFVPGPVLRFLGISSPSKLFEGIGRNVGLGLGVGITGSAPVVAAAATRLAATASTAATGVLSERGRAAQELLDHLARGGGVFEDLSFRGQSGLVGANNDALAEAFGASGGQDLRRFLTDVASQRSAAMPPAASAARSAPMVLQVRSSGRPVDDFIAELIRRYVKVNGGDVQVVFGR